MNFQALGVQLFSMIGEGTVEFLASKGGDRDAKLGLIFGGG